MKILISLCLLALAVSPIYSQATSCADIGNCDSCVDNGPQCEECPDGYAMASDSQSCLICSTNCVKCTANADNTDTTCDSDGCVEGTYLTATGTCETCGTGCKTCALDTTSTLVCSECFAAGYVLDTTSSTCTACPSNCETCSLTDGSPVCSKCYTFPGQDIQGYFLKTSDKTCKTCGSRASQCTDNGSGVASITACYSGYEVKSDNTKCLLCPTGCSSCSGDELDGSATCTACTDALGNFLVDGKCEQCTTNCLTCDDASNCGTCATEYRVDGGSCLQCPANCDACSNDATLGEVCDTCKTSFGEKLTTSITCDKCTKSNCAVCAIDGNTGVHSCTTCLTGYAKNGNDECVACPTGCSTCAWETTADGDYMLCTACDTAYGGPFPSNTDSTFASQSACEACSAIHASCTGCSTTQGECDACASGFFVNSATCEAQDVANCAVYTTNAGTCVTCADGYDVNSDNTACEQCTGTNCQTCTTDLAICSACASGSELYDSTGDGNNDQCKACGISRCAACTTDSNGDVLCDTCETTYTVYDRDTESTTQGTSCRKCPTGCDTCTYDYANTQTTCNSNGCSSGYAYDGNGGCTACPSECTACTVTDGNVACDAASCNSGFQVNENTNECDACPDNCLACEWDSSTSTIVCTDNECETGYGKVSGGLCAACPSDCDTCTVDDATNFPDLLTCSTCKSGYAKNELVCAACPSNCDDCTDQDGTMECTACKTGYALDSTTKACIACFANCESCTSSNEVVKCSDCRDGYSLAVDKLSCTVCSTAAFENCATCEDMTADSETALCNTCNTGYTLEDENKSGPCIDVTSLTCQGADVEDEPPKCQTCASGFSVTSDGNCAITCYRCGDVANDVTGLSLDTCQIPAANTTNPGVGFATEVECLSGICVTFRFTSGTILMGCAPATDNGSPYSCTADKQEEFCQTGAIERCEKCCTSDKCNNDPGSLDGKAFGIPTCSTNIVLLVAAALLAIFRA